MDRSPGPHLSLEAPPPRSYPIFGNPRRRRPGARCWGWRGSGARRRSPRHRRVCHTEPPKRERSSPTVSLVGRSVGRLASPPAPPKRNPPMGKGLQRTQRVQGRRPLTMITPLPGGGASIHLRGGESVCSPQTPHIHNTHTKRRERVSARTTIPDSRVTDPGGQPATVERQSGETNERRLRRPPPSPLPLVLAREGC